MENKTLVNFYTYLLILFLIFLSGCSSHQPSVQKPIKKAEPVISRIAYTVQIGAFRQASNAVNMTKKLKHHNVDSYHYIHPSGLYKVRFGNYSSFSSAKFEADRLKSKGIIKNYYILEPGKNLSDSNDQEKRLRTDIVITAKRFIGVPYKWGGTSKNKGFDCSGLTMVVYRLNGLNLPRNSRNQYKTGKAISKDKLQHGDLVFFRTERGKRVSHVGIYTGNGSFIHAPKPGKSITTTKLSNSYFKKRYVGARSYL